MNPNSIEMQHDIDMAGAIADRHLNVAIGLGGPLHKYSILLTPEVNQGINKILGIDKMGDRKRRNQNLKIYTMMIFRALASCPSGIKGLVLIDEDYDPDSTARAKKKALSLLRRERIKREYRIESGRVGKRSPSHEISNDVYRGEKEADLILEIESSVDFLNSFNM